jgi:hypothetical protein
MADLTFLRKTGAGFVSVFDDLAALRMAVFRDYPYLYDGTVEYEKAYLQTYVNAEQSFLFAVYDGPRMVGATTCIPLADETEDVKKSFRDAGYPLENVFYFGESILLPAYRGLGLGHRFFDEREAHVVGLGGYNLMCFCAVDRPPDHPLQPADYQPLDGFWTKRGYRKNPALQSSFFWQDIGAPATTGKKMIFWVKKKD